MAKNKLKTPGDGALKKLASQISNSINGMYRNTYYTPPTNMRDLRNIKDDINASIDNITNINMSATGESNISKLYSRLYKTLEDPKVVKGLDDMLNDRTVLDSIFQSYTENKYILDLDKEIDAVCKMQPKLVEALDTKKDMVLSADHFSKDFIIPINNTTTSKATFDKRAEAIKKKYEFLQKSEEWYMNASKYGEEFVWIVPYSRAIKKLMKNATQSTMDMSFESTVITETFAFGESTDFKVQSTMSRDSINVEMDMSGMLSEAVLEYRKAIKRKSVIRESSLCLEFASIISEEASKAEEDKLIKTPKKKFDKTIKDDIDVSEFRTHDSIAQDGLIDKSSKDKDIEDISVPGCIIKRLDHVYVKPYYIEDLCLGYFYMELKKNQTFDFDHTSNLGLASMTNSKALARKALEDEKNSDMTLKKTAAEISAKITPKFVNDNVDISKEIYMLLKYNEMYNSDGKDSIRVTFLPADDVVHIKFKEDPNTHRGITDLEYSLFPGKLRSCIQLTYAIANMTRGYDRRAYYVKQSVETNIAKSLLNVINQLKANNFNVRHIDNIENIFNITGVLNDYLIPTMGGDPPIQFEVIPGQRIEPPTELLNELEEVMVNQTDVPLEVIQARQSMDYAVHYTMTNSKFLRKIYHRQGQYQPFLSDIFTKIYNYEYEDDTKVEIQLPPPMFLNITNTNQIISNVNEYTDQIVNIDMADETNEVVRNIYTRKVKLHYLGTYLDVGILDRLKEEAQHEASVIGNKES